MVIETLKCTIHYEGWDWTLYYEQDEDELEITGVYVNDKGPDLAEMLSSYVIDEMRDELIDCIKTDAEEEE